MAWITQGTLLQRENYNDPVMVRRLLTNPPHQLLIHHYDHGNIFKHRSAIATMENSFSNFLKPTNPPTKERTQTDKHGTAMTT
jgi:hypothetical protein